MPSPGSHSRVTNITRAIVLERELDLLGPREICKFPARTSANGVKCECNISYMQLNSVRFNGGFAEDNVCEYGGCTHAHTSRAATDALMLNYS